MSQTTPKPVAYFNAFDGVVERFHKFVCGNRFFRSLLFKTPFDNLELKPSPAIAKLEIVSHCWNYSHLLAYQLWSVVNHAPIKHKVTITVFYSAEDKKTEEVLAFFGGLSVENVTWNWHILPKTQLLRRAIGRNLAAKATTADWIWFTDCDVVFGEQCLNSLLDNLAGKTHVLAYPRVENRSDPLPDDHPVLARDIPVATIKRIDPSLFHATLITRATGPLQIVHGDMARAAGYCDTVRIYQKPTRVWRKATEDRIFRWLLNTSGTAIDVDGFYRIEHQVKGRYSEGWWAKVRTLVQRVHGVRGQRI